MVFGRYHPAKRAIVTQRNGWLKCATDLAQGAMIHVLKIENCFEWLIFLDLHTDSRYNNSTSGENL